MPLGGQVGTQNPSKILPKSIKIRSKSTSSSLKIWRACGVAFWWLLGPTLAPTWPQHKPKMVPTWPHLGGPGGSNRAGGGVVNERSKTPRLAKYVPFCTQCATAWGFPRAPYHSSPSSHDSQPHSCLAPPHSASALAISPVPRRVPRSPLPASLN